MIKNFFIGLLVLIAILLIGIFILLFTSFGNAFLKPHIQNKINAYSPIPMSLDIFVLRIGSFDFEVNSQNNIKITSHGTFSLISQDIDAMLNIDIKNPSNIKEIADAGINLQKDFLIESVIRGKLTSLEINTTSNIANGNLRIDTTVDNFSPSKIIASLENLQIASLLGVLGKKPYADGKVMFKADIIGGDKLQFVGKANLIVNNGSVSKELVKEDFDLEIPDTTFVVNLSADFNGVDIIHKLEFLSNIGNINSDGSTVLKTLRTTSNYDINISNLSPITPFVGIPLKGAFRTDGKIVGNSKWMNIDGKSDFASGNTEYSISLEEYTKPKDLLVRIKNLKIEDVLYTLVKPIYAQGLFNATADLKGISSNINGSYSHTLSGNIKKDVIRKEFDINLPNDLGYIHKASTTINNGDGLINADIFTDLANLNVKNAVLKIDNISLNAPYTIDIEDLRKFKFITPKELQGKISANGVVKYSTKALYADFKSNLFGGNLDVVLNDNLANIIIKNMNLTGILDMLQYPQFFKSNMNGDIKYNMETSQGTMELILNEGSFAENKLTNLLQNLLKFNVTKEVFNNIKIDGTINKKLVNANLNMLSNNTSISSKDVKIDIEKDNIDANLLLKIQNYELGAIVKGKVGSPNIKLDTKKLGKDIVKDVVESKKFQEQKEKLEDKAKDAIKKGLDKLFK